MSSPAIGVPTMSVTSIIVYTAINTCLFYVSVLGIL